MLFCSDVTVTVLLYYTYKFEILTYVCLASLFVNTSRDGILIDPSVGRRRWCRLIGVEVVQSESDSLTRLGAYRPSLSTVIA